MGSDKRKVVIVTGAAHGIGHAISHKLAGLGAIVVAVDNNRAAGRAVAEALRLAELDVQFIQADVGKTADVLDVISTVEREYGRLDWIVNNAGFGSGRMIDEIEVDEFERIIAVNLKAAFLFAKFGASLLRKSPAAAIVNISSTRALLSEPGDEAYAASKAGLLGLTHALANSLGPAVRVNAICPGWIDVSEAPEKLRREDHAQHPAGRVGRPADIAAMTAFLLSAEASFITGQAFVVDGGMTKKMIYLD